jgi:hypothetical protein
MLNVIGVSAVVNFQAESELRSWQLRQPDETDVPISSALRPW